MVLKVKNIPGRREEMKEETVGRRDGAKRQKKGSSRRAQGGQVRVTWLPSWSGHREFQRRRCHQALNS